MRDIEKEIQDSLDEIERIENVEVLLAVESGSRAWGFASPDSDYDVRIIYMQKPEEYLRVDEQKDYIDWALDEVMDINGWDLKKALLNFEKGNPNLMEWAMSPIVYRKSDKWDRIEPVVKKCFSEKASLNHYYGTANSTYHKALMGEKVKYKKYFYALRPLLCCRWIERFHEIPPMRFEELLKLFDGSDRDLSEELLTEINRLVEKKVVTEEKELNDHIPMIRSFIETELLRQHDNADMAEDDRIKDFTEINALFRSLIIK
jgi:hypothetical protein